MSFFPTRQMFDMYVYILFRSCCILLYASILSPLASSWLMLRLWKVVVAVWILDRRFEPICLAFSSGIRVFWIALNALSIAVSAS